MYKFGAQSEQKMMLEITVNNHLCGHPNIVQLHHVVKQSLTSYPVLLFEFVQNTNYYVLCPTLSPEDIQWYAYELLKGIAFAHRRGVIHNDLKPANIVIDHPERILKIIDWGLSSFHRLGATSNNMHSATNYTVLILHIYPFNVCMYSLN